MLAMSIGPTKMLRGLFPASFLESRSAHSGPAPDMQRGSAVPENGQCVPVFSPYVPVSRCWGLEIVVQVLVIMGGFRFKSPVFLYGNGSFWYEAGSFLYAGVDCGTLFPRNREGHQRPIAFHSLATSFVFSPKTRAPDGIRPGNGPGETGPIGPGF